MQNGTIPVSPEALQAVKSAQTVNMDEVTNETIHVKLYLYREEPLVDDEGNPFCAPDGTQYRGRVVVGTRTAKIKNIVPIDAYNEAIALMNGFAGSLTTDQLDAMTNLVLRCWQISEPFMSREMLLESVEAERIMALFTRFFDKQTRLLNSNQESDAGTTQG